MKKRYSKTLSNERTVKCSLVDPQLSQKGFVFGQAESQKKLPFSQKRALCLLYGRSARSRFSEPLSPQEIAVVHLLVQKNVLREDVIHSLCEVLALPPQEFHDPNVYNAETGFDSDLLDAVHYLEEDRRIYKNFPEMFGGQRNDHHIIPRKTWPDEFKTGRRDGNTLRMNTVFHTEHWHGLYGVRHPLEIDRHFYFELGHIDLLSEKVRAVVASLLKRPLKEFYKDHLLKN